MAIATSPRTSNEIPIHKARFYVPIKQTVLALGEVFDRQGDVVQLTGFPVRIFCFRHPEHVKQILKHPEFGNTKFPKILPRVKWTMRSGGYILKGGEQWKQRRLQVQTAFRRERLTQYADLVPPLAEDMLDGWKERAQTGDSFDVFRELRHLITRSSFTLSHVFFQGSRWRGTRPNQR